MKVGKVSKKNFEKEGNTFVSLSTYNKPNE